MPNALAALALLAMMAGGAAAVGPAYPPGDCRTGTPACDSGCCTRACPGGSAGAAVPDGIPGLTASIQGLTYHAATSLVKGTLIMTNSGKTAVDGVIAEVGFAPFGDDRGHVVLGNMWCGGQKGKALGPGQSRACPFAVVGGADPASYDWRKSTDDVAQPGVDAAALRAARAWSTSDVPQFASLARGLAPSAVRARATLRNTQLYPREFEDSGFICAYGFVPATKAA